MRRPLLALAATALALVTLDRPADACTTFMLEGDAAVVVGKSYDWSDGRGMVVINKRGVRKVAVPNGPGDTPARWVSKHASVTFNQYGRELPNGGMNDAGLVVEVMWLEGARFAAADERPMVNELQWIQYQLDSFATVAEVVAHAPKLRVSNLYARVHYLACDATGACAAVEPIDGALVVTSGAALRVPVLTNHTFADAAATLPTYRGFGGDAALPGGKGSLARFVRAAAATRAPTGDLASAALRVLDDVSMGDYSKWNIVYEPRERRLGFRTAGRRDLKRLDLDDLDGSCKTPVKVIDLAAAGAGDVTPRLVDYTTAANSALVGRTLGALGLGRELAGQLARYPESLPCSL